MFIENGLVVDDQGRAYGVFIVHQQPGISESMERAQISTLERGLREVVGEWWVFSLALGLSPSQWNARLLQGAHPLWQAHRKEAETTLQSELPFERKVYLVVPLDNLRILELGLSTLRQFGKTITQDVWRGVRDALAVVWPSSEVTVDQLSRWERERKRKAQAFSSFLPIRQATLREIEAWWRHGAYRGLIEPDSRLPKGLPKVVSASGVVHVAYPLQTLLQEAAFRERAFHLEGELPDGRKTYQTFFAMLRAPREIPADNPVGHEWIYAAELLDYPVDIALHVRVEDSRSALRHLSRKKGIAEAQLEEYESAGEEAPLELLEELDTTAELERNLRLAGSLVHVKMIVGLGAPDEDTLRQRAKRLVTDLGDIQLVQAPGDQQRFWQAFYPWGRGVQTAYEIPMDAGLFAAALPFATQGFGDPRGMLLGETNLGRPVFFDPRRPAQELDRPPSVLICGTLGSGKTVTTAYVAAMLLAQGARVFVQDPKGHDYDGLAQLPNVRSRFLRMTPDEGTPINPCRLGVPGAERGVLDILLNDTTDPNVRDLRSILIGRAVSAMHKAGGKQDLWAIAEAIEELVRRERRPVYREQGELLLERLDALSKDALGRLLFAEDDGTTPRDYDLTVVATNGLTLPGANSTVWNEQERVSVALFYAAATMGLGYFSGLPKEVVKALVLDEAWQLRRFPAGRDLVDRLLRVSRSLNIIPLMLMQNATDFEQFGESITGLFSWRFCMRQLSRPEVAASLRILNLPDDEAAEWEKTFGGFASGEAMAMDAEGRVARMHIILRPAWLKDLLSTTPGIERR